MNNLDLIIFCKKHVFDINKNNEFEIDFHLFNKNFTIRKKSKDYEIIQAQITDLNTQVQTLTKANKLLNALLERSIDIQKVPCAKGNRRKVQLIKTKLLELVSLILDRNNITYWLDYGTLIGAIRHDGFIPWDDDVDISLLKDDYFKLPQILEDFSKINPDFRFTYSQYYSVIFRFEYKEFCVDFFPFEYIKKEFMTDGEKEIFLQNWYKLHDILFEKYPAADYEKELVNGVLIQKDVENFKREILSNSYITNKNSDKLVYSPEFTFVCNKCTILDTINIFPLEKHSFENIEFPIPNNPIEHLFELGIYGEKGDVMNFPKITDSGFHHTQSNFENSEIDYDKIYNELDIIVDKYKKEY